MKYAKFDKNGFPLGFYDSEIHGKKVPKTAIKITNEQWNEFIENQGIRKWDGQKIVEYVHEISNEELKQNRIAEIKAQLLDIDKRSIRPIRDGDTEYLKTLKSEADALRLELSKLND